MQPPYTVENCQVVNVQGQEVLRVNEDGTILYNYSRINREETLRLAIALIVVLRDANILEEDTCTGLICRLSIEMDQEDWADQIHIGAKIDPDKTSTCPGDELPY